MEDDAGTSGMMDLETFMAAPIPSYAHAWSEKDLALYALGAGCSVGGGGSGDDDGDLRYLYEQHPSFGALPTFGVMLGHRLCFTVPMDRVIPNYAPVRALHGEQYLELHASLPPAGKAVTRAQVVDVQPKGRGAVAVLRTTSVDDATGRLLAVNEFTSFCLGTGPFEGCTRPLPRAVDAVAANAPPRRAPDAVLAVPTGVDQAALYRLSGDLNPLHIDPQVAAAVGFPRPILHGLCTLAASARAIVRAYGRDDAAGVATIKVRFAKHVFPGETLEVACWVVGDAAAGGRVVFETRVRERGGVAAITAAAVQFKPGAFAVAAPPPRHKL